MLKYEMDEKVVRQQVTNRGKREKKRKFSPQSLTIKIIKSSKVTKKERKENKIKEKEKGEIERKKEKRNCFPL